MELQATLPSKRHKTASVNKGYDVSNFVEGCRDAHHRTRDVEPANLLLAQ